MTSTPADPFAVLGLPARPDLAGEQVRAAWRQVATATHPDRPDGGDPKSTPQRRRQDSRAKSRRHCDGHTDTPASYEPPARPRDQPRASPAGPGRAAGPHLHPVPARPVRVLSRQFRSCEEWLPAGWYIVAWFWDVESGGIDLENRSATDSFTQFPGAAALPRDGGMAELLEEAASPEPRFAAVVCEDIERSGRDTFNALKLERELSDKGMPLFATDEPASVQEISPATVLVRRVKQGVAEYFRLAIKKKAWEGLRQHTISGWNIGPAPYGYLAERVTHPVPMKAAQGRTKTRLALDPVRGPVVEQIYTWRVEGQLGVPAITARLNADHGAYPPPDGQHWAQATVAAILANPKYTGYMVYGRRRKTGRRASRPVPPAQWIWSDQPAHPAIITRPMFDAAQAIAAAHRTAGDDPDAAPQPLARRSYALRGRVRHRTCQRRMCGTTRTSPRYWAEGPDYAHAYYKCPHDSGNPKHAATHPDHPRTVTVREDVLVELIRQFFARHIFGPERRALLAEQIPASAAQAAEQRDRLAKELARIDLAQRSQITQIETLDPDPANHAAQAMRARCPERFAELHTERETTQAQLDALDQAATRDDDAALLDDIALLASTVALHPEHIQAALYQAFDIQALYKDDMHQVSFFATITTSTPHAVAAILAAAGNDPAARTPDPAQPPAPAPASTPAIYPLTQRPHRAPNPPRS
jgi:site-specific DNA recombinase